MANLTWEEIRKIRVPEGTVIFDGIRTLRHESEPSGPRDNIRETAPEAVPYVAADIGGKTIGELLEGSDSPYLYGGSLKLRDKISGADYSFLQAYRASIEGRYPEVADRHSRGKYKEYPLLIYRHDDLTELRIPYTLQQKVDLIRGSIFAPLIDGLAGEELERKVNAVWASVAKFAGL